MVSFQCDACTDVVKKPKLDQHRARCGASFTCIDCSKTFQTPVDWKGHTSCISEAEKYQKTLYKPKATGGGRENTYRNGSRGKFQGRGGSWGKPSPRSQATGANGTPLGTPTRMSPVTAPLKQDETNGTTLVSESAMKTEEPKKHKKGKSEVTNITRAEPVNQSAGDPISREQPRDMIEKEGKKEKKKKEKKEKDEKKVASDMGAMDVALSGVLPSTPVGAGDEIATEARKEKKDKKKEKKEKKEKPSKHDSAIPPESNSNNVEPASVSLLLPPDAAGSEKSRQSKKNKTEMVETGDAPNQVSAAEIGGEKQKKKKKRKSEVANGAPEVNGEVAATCASSETTSTKRKREAEEQDVTGQEVASEKKKKKKQKTVAVS